MSVFTKAVVARRRYRTNCFDSQYKMPDRQKGSRPRFVCLVYRRKWQSTFTANRE